MATKNGNTIRKLKKAGIDALIELRQPRNMRIIGREAAAIVRKRTLLGFGVAENGGNRKRLKPLSDSYKAQRRGEVAFITLQGRVIPVKPIEPIRLSSKTTPGKSNLTLGGELLDSLKEFVTGLGKVEVRPAGSRRDGLTNEEVAEFVSKDRPFLNLSKNEIKQIEELTNDQFLALVNKNLTKL